MIKVLMCYFRCLGTCRRILTRFDPRYSEEKKTPTDALKLWCCYYYYYYNNVEWGRSGERNSNVRLVTCELSHFFIALQNRQHRTAAAVAHLRLLHVSWRFFCFLFLFLDLPFSPSVHTYNMYISQLFIHFIYLSILFAITLHIVPTYLIHYVTLVR